MLRASCVVTILSVLSIAVAADDVRPIVNLDTRTSFETRELDVFHAVLTLAMENHLPLEILPPGSGMLCQLPARSSYKNATLKEILTELLSRTKSEVAVENGVVKIRPNQVPQSARELLSIRFDQFNGGNTTMQGQGVILSGYILSRLYPGQAYAGNILENPTATHLPPFQLRNASVEEILDHIVSERDMGVWIASSTVDSGHQAASIKDVRISIFAYKDDAIALGQLSCAQSLR